ncbi:S-methyl-5-thioribose kinase [Enterococcus sp. AZ103]|uniref:S-methyl-5-thioribose kinase n=1 Tax=Enterococcus sp. AZ103 TaxID=2774628 RepID=UPI003F2642DE
MTNYQAHFLMDDEAIKDFVVSELQLFPDKKTLEVAEIGDGNINYVHQVIDQATKKTVVVKQADKFLRASGRPLDLARNRIEADILKIQGELAPQFVPAVFNYHEKMAALTMEDISDYQNMRYQMIEKNIFPKFSQEISQFLAEVLLPTTDLVLARDEKKQRVKAFTNIEMSDISEDLVLIEPYWDYKKRNIITAGNEDFVMENLYQNDALQVEVAYLRNQFMNNSQALIHGDLHTGSIFINHTGIKVIDPEFAFYGPMGYDIGNVLAHLVFPLILNQMDGHFDQDFDHWLTQSIEKVFDLTFEKIANTYDDQVKLPMYLLPGFKEQYLAEVMADSLGYAGTEIIRRVVGDTKVKELSLLPEKARIPAERILIQFATDLIMNRDKITHGQEISAIFTKREKDETTR